LKILTKCCKIENYKEPVLPDNATVEQRAAF
jgi:hypothetical protein